MDYNTIGQFIGSVGFPIVAACALFWMINTTMKEFTETMQKMNNTLTAMLEHEKRTDVEVKA